MADENKESAASTLPLATRYNMMRINEALTNILVRDLPTIGKMELHYYTQNDPVAARFMINLGAVPLDATNVWSFNKEKSDRAIEMIKDELKHVIPAPPVPPALEPSAEPSPKRFRGPMIG